LIHKLTIKDVSKVAELLQALTIELMPEYATSDELAYRAEVMGWLNSDVYTVFVDDDYRGFIVLLDESERITPNYHRIINTKIYIKPEARGSTLYSHFYKAMLQEFPTGDIMGLTEVNSPHIKTLDKRHERIAIVYRVNRSKQWV